jgi:hypothetical protein
MIGWRAAERPSPGLAWRLGSSSAGFSAHAPTATEKLGKPPSAHFGHQRTRAPVGGIPVRSSRFADARASACHAEGSAEAAC